MWKNLRNALAALLTALAVGGVGGMAYAAPDTVVGVEPKVRNTGEYYFETTAGQYMPTPGELADIVFAETNDVRARYGLRTLKYHGGLNDYALNWSAHMARTNTFEHSPDEYYHWDGKARGMGENLFTGTKTTWTDVVSDWMASPGHRQNILDPALEYMAVAVVQTASGRWYVTQVMM